VVIADTLTKRAREAGVLMFVDVDNRVKMYPANKMPDDLKRLCSLHYWEIHEWLMLDASLRLSI
jgi:hypothetical protein